MREVPQQKDDLLTKGFYEGLQKESKPTLGREPLNSFFVVRVRFKI